MTKKEAIKQLIIDYKNSFIANEWEGLTELDKEMIKALKIKKE